MIRTHQFHSFTDALTETEGSRSYETCQEYVNFHIKNQKKVVRNYILLKGQFAEIHSLSDHQI